MVWSAFGRAHPETQVMLSAMAVQAARRRGLRDHRLILRRARGAIGVQLVRRAVSMLLGFIPRLETEEERALFGSRAEGEATWPELRGIVLRSGGADAPPA